VNGDIAVIGSELTDAGQELLTVVAESSIPKSEKLKFEEQIWNAIGRQAEIMNAADGLMELLIHRVFYFSPNVRYETIEDWLGAHRITRSQEKAILEFGDADVIERYRASNRSSGEGEEAGADQ